ncbi:MAG: hypothetical protein NVSMB64_30650 [Candidatus Velthaea sp.]
MIDPRRANDRAEAKVMASGFEREPTLVRRSWTRAERRIVLRGLVGRLLIAIEPVICTTIFGALTAGLIFFPLPASSNLTHRESAFVIAPVFGLITLAFIAYAVILLVPPLRALIQTFSPIYIVDGYLRYRRPDRKTEADSNGYVAVLNDERRTICEWPVVGETPIADSIRPAMIEFSYYGGIHRIDGRSTGVVPASMPPAGIGGNVPRV